MKPFRTILFGCGGMGRHQARLLHEHPDFQLCGVCDVSAERAQAVAGELNVPAYTDSAAAWRESKAEVAVICTGNDTHAALTFQALESGARGVYCEKPMAVDLRDARAMVAEAKRHGAVLAINHQRRLMADLRAARALVEAGAIGEVRYWRGECAGDLLSDGTHLIDSLLFLAGETRADWVLGQAHRDLEEMARRHRQNKTELPPQPGFRYGHPVETGTVGIVQLANGVRLELFTGDMIRPGTPYQNYVGTGSNGRLWRTGDQFPNLYIQDSQPGIIGEGVDSWFHKPTAQAGAGQPLWREVPFDPGQRRDGIKLGYSFLAESLRTGAPHPLDSSIALAGFEILTAIYESARVGRRLVPPVTQDRFPVSLMLEEGRFGNK